MRAIFLPIFLLTFLFSSLPAFSSNIKDSISFADSLFRAENFAEAGNVYGTILSSSGNYSPSMLMKLAYIEEQKQNIGGALYYLTLYHQYHPDKRVRNKIISLSEKYNLQGYSFNEVDKALYLIKEHKRNIAAIVCVLLTLYSIHLYLKKRKQVPLGIRPFLLIITTFLLFYLFKFRIERSTAISVNGPCAIMEGPSAASKLIYMMPDGNKLKVTGEADIWYEVEYKGEKAYIRKAQARKML